MILLVKVNETILFIRLFSFRIKYYVKSIFTKFIKLKFHICLYTIIYARNVHITIRTDGNRLMKTPILSSSVIGTQQLSNEA